MIKAQFLIAGLVYELKTADKSHQFKVPSVYEPFLVSPDQPSEAKAGLSLSARFDDFPAIDGDIIFDSNGPWKLWGKGDQYILSLHSAENRDEPYQIAIMDQDFTEGETFVRPAVFEQLPDYFPFTYPLDECLAINRISHGYGIEVHACGLSDSGKGILFLGVSGSGKSTMSRIWDEQEDVLVLSDDRIIITRKDGSYWIHGTPWHGDAGIADPGGVPLGAFFFIRHAPENKSDTLTPTLAASQLLARSFPTYWDREGMQFCIDICGDIAQAVPAYELEFAPGAEVVSFVREMLG